MRDVQSSLYIDELSRLTALALQNPAAARARLGELCIAARHAGRPERAAVLAAQAVQSEISDFATLVHLRSWGSMLTSTAVDPSTLETHAALVWCAGMVAAHLFKDCFDADVAARLPPVDMCLNHHRHRLLSIESGPELDANIVVATAEHPASWWSNTGDHGAIDEIGVAVERALASPQLDPHIRARWLFWLGCIQMQGDQRASAEATWARARAATSTPWSWLEFHLHRVAVRPLLEDGRQEAARARIEALKAEIDARRPLDLGDYHHLRGWLALLDDEPRLAVQHYRLALEAATRAALPAHMSAIYQSGLAQSLVAMGEEDAAVDVYRQLAFAPGPKGQAQREASIELAQAVHARRTDSPDYAKHLARGLAAARDLGLLRILRALPRLAGQIAADALELDIEPDFVRRMIAARRLAPPPEAGECWPWPVKLLGLRPFAIVIDGEPLRFEGKVPAKPLQLMRLLIAHAGEPVAIGYVTDRLWPDLDAPEARRAFDVALHRLRALLAQPDLLTLADGRLRFDSSRVWSDVRALDAALRECGREEHTSDAQRRKHLFERLAQLYRAPLLQGDDDPWVVGARDALRRRFVLGVESLARAAERDAQGAEAAWMRQWAASLAADR